MRQDDGRYVFTQDGSVKLTGRNDFAVMAEDTVVIDATGKKLVIENNSEKRSDAYGIATNGRELTITADKLEISAKGANRAEAIHACGTTTLNADVTVKMEGAGYVLGSYVRGSHLTVNGSYTADALNSDSGLQNNDASRPSKAYDHYEKSNLYAGNGAIIDINGATKLGVVKGAGVVSNQGGSVVNLNGDVDIRTIDTRKDEVFAAVAESSTVNINVNENRDGAAGHKVFIKGNLAVLNGAVHPAERSGKTTINLGMDTPDSVWTGTAIDNFTQEDLDGTKVMYGETVAPQHPAINLFISKGAVWNHQQVGKALFGLETSKVANLHAGKGDDRAIIFQKDDKDIEIANFEGDAVVLFNRDADNATEVEGGSIIVNKAAADSNMLLRTDNTGLDLSEPTKEETKTLVNTVLDNLAKKLTYLSYADANGGERNLAGKVEIAEGLTARAAMKSFGDIAFSTADGTGSLKDGKGHTVVDSLTPLDPSTPVDPTPVDPVDPEEPGDDLNGQVSFGSDDTAMMRGARAGMILPSLAFRNGMNDISKRLGDIRFAGGEAGAWALIEGGKASYNGANIESELKYTGVQAGYDVKRTDGLMQGLSFQYLDGDGNGTFENGDVKNYALAGYVSKVNPDNSYFDIIGKVGRISSDFHVTNMEGKHLDGDFKTNAYMISAEYGKRFEQRGGFFVEPQVELTYGRTQGKAFDAKSDFAGNPVLHIDQDAFKSFVARAGVAAGRVSDRGSLYAKVSVSHEMLGDWSTRYSAEGQPTTVKTFDDMKDTWLTFQLGGTLKMSDHSYAYANVLTTAGGDYKEKGKINAGMRWSF